MRFLLVRSRPGELPWLATMIARTMAPAEITQVIGFANALWRLGDQDYDSVLLDLDLRDPASIACCREQIAKVAAVPVLNLRDGAAEETAQVAVAAPAEPEPAPARSRSTRRTPRAPWQRRPRRQQPARAAEAASAG